MDLQPRDYGAHSSYLVSAVGRLFSCLVDADKIYSRPPPKRMPRSEFMFGLVRIQASTIALLPVPITGVFYNIALPTFVKEHLSNVNDF